MEQWYSIERFRFTKPQICWVLYYLSEMKTEWWPTNPTESGYNIELPPSHKSRRYRSPFGERIRDITADIELRLDRTGRDGDLLRTRYSELYRDDYDCYRLARKLGMPIDELERRINKVLNCIAGWSWEDRIIDDKVRYGVKSRLRQFGYEK